MGMFDNIDWGDPNAMAQLGAMQGYGQAAMPSRMPVPFGMVQGMAAEGAIKGARGAQEYKQSQAQTIAAQMANMDALQQLNLRNQMFGHRPLTLSDLAGSKISDEYSTLFGDVAQGASSPTQQPPSGPDGVLNGAPGSMSGGPVGGLITLNGARARQASMPQGASSMPMGASASPGGAPMPQMAGGPAPMSPMGMPAGPDGVPTPPAGMSPIMAGIYAKALRLSGYQEQKFIADAMRPGPEKDFAEQAALHAGGIESTIPLKANESLAMRDPYTGKISMGIRNPGYAEGITLDANGQPIITPESAAAMGKIESIKQGAHVGAEQSIEKYKHDLEFGPGGPAPGGGGFGSGGGGGMAMPSPSGTAKLPDAIKSDNGTVIPDISTQAPIPTDSNSLRAAIPAWQKKTDELSAAVAPSQQAEERLGTIAQAFKLTEPGAYAAEKGQLAAIMKSLGLPAPELLGNPGAVQAALHENAIKTLSSLKASTNRFTQMEFKTLSSQSEHPNLQPEANLQQLGEDIAAMRQQRFLADDWQTARTHYGWRNPSDFETVWMKKNPYAPMVQAVKTEIGPLKGMPGGPGSAFDISEHAPDVQQKILSIQSQFQKGAISRQQAREQAKALGVRIE